MIQEQKRLLIDFGKTIDPFQEGLPGKTIRAIGLNKLYPEMVDPSFELIDVLSKNLVDLPLSYLNKLSYSTYDATQDLERSEKFFVGALNTTILLDKIRDKYNPVTGELMYPNINMDPKEIAESVYEFIQISNNERLIEKSVKEVSTEVSLNKRYRKALGLRRQILSFVNRFKFKFYYSHDKEECIEPTWKNLSRGVRLSIRLDTKDSIKYGNFVISESVVVAKAAITRYALERKFKKLPKKDNGKLDQLRLEYGAKAANLMTLSEMVHKINKLRKNQLEVNLLVPEFKAIPVGVFKDWSCGKSIDESLRTYYEWTKTLEEDDIWSDEEKSVADIMVRSSAVFSEDGDNSTGAGIYDSVSVSRNADFKDFKNAVVKVYRSVKSSKAKNYRKQQCVGLEEMGLVIQKKVSRIGRWSIFNQSQAGYVNSRLAGVPQLMEIVTETSRNFINREQMDFYLALSDTEIDNSYNGVHHFPPDINFAEPELPIRVGQLANIIERIWGFGVQVEFLGDGSTINVVQIRELPQKNSLSTPEVLFPEETPLYTNASVGVGDMELKVLDNGAQNTNKEGLVVFTGNYGWTMRQNNFHLPKRGAVIITNRNAQNGHIQTLCIEKGLVCIFSNTYDARNGNDYKDLCSLKKVRIVSNGMEGRVYKIE